MIQKAPTTRVVFVQDKFFLGGIEVLELKLAEELSRLGYDVVVASRGHEMLSQDSLNFTHFSHLGYPDFISKSESLATDYPSTIIFVSLHPTAAMAAEIAGRKIMKLRGDSTEVRHFHWVSHSRAFFFSQRYFIQRMYKLFFEILPLKSTYFMNDAAKEAHQTYWYKSLDNYPVIRIVGREPDVRFPAATMGGNTEIESEGTSLRIVSVGRLVPFKSYNISAPEVVRRLLDSGINVTWDIWGYGPEESAIVAKARLYDVNDRVVLHGSLPHDRFDETVSSYDVFVGMGTAVLEAANTGTPSCVAIENQGDACYGFLHEAPTDSVGDRVEGIPELRLHEVLCSFASLNSEDRSKIGQKDALAVKQKESTLKSFVAAILSAEPIRQSGAREQAILSLIVLYLKIRQWKLERSES